jgi:MFS family permease
MLFTLSGVFMALNQGFFLKRVWLKHFNDVQLEFGMLAVLGVGLLLMSVHSVWFFAVGTPVLSIAQSTLRIVITSRAAGAADPQMKGEIIGILTSIFAGAMVVGPVVAGTLFELWLSLPFLTAAACTAVALFISYRRSRIPAVHSNATFTKKAKDLPTKYY